MKKLARQLPQALVLILLTACFGAKESKNPNNSGSRVELHAQGITIDAKYNADLDNLIPGYKIVTVGLTNNGVDILKLNPLRDRWEIVDAAGRKIKAYNCLRIKDPHTFSRLPSRMKEMIEYPVAVPLGYSETLDLFFPNHIDLTGFRSISFYSAERKQDYDMLAIDPSRETPVTGIAVQDSEPDPRWAPKKKK